MKRFILILLLFAVMNSGCAFYRHDIDTAYNPTTKQNEIVRDSRSYWSILKNITLKLGDIEVNSEVQDFEVKAFITELPLGVSVGDKSNE